MRSCSIRIKSLIVAAGAACGFSFSFSLLVMFSMGQSIMKWKQKNEDNKLI